MAFGSFDSGSGGSRTMAEINMVPLIDVMLVLLVIFIITAPLLTHAVKLELPKATSAPNLTKPDNIQLAIDAAGLLHWNGEIVDRAGLRQRLAAASKLEPRDSPARGSCDAIPHGRRGARRFRQGGTDAHRLCQRSRRREMSGIGQHRIS